MPQLRRGPASARIALLSVVVLLLAGLSATTAAAVADDDHDQARAKIAKPLLGDLAKPGRDDYVIEFDGTPDLSKMADIDDWQARGLAVMKALQQAASESQADVIAELDARGVDYQSFWIDNTVHVEGGTEQLALSVAADAEVSSVREPVEAPLEKPEKASTRKAAVSGVEWGIADIKADQVWEQTGVRGEGLVVANIDSGVQFDHPALVAAYRGNNGDGTFDHNYNWWDATGLCGDTPCDTVGHGTHTMGTMVGDGGEGAHIGVAPGAQWIAVKGCEQFGCTEEGLTSAAQWILAPTDLSGANPDPSRRPNIVNSSWSTPGGNDFYDAFVDAWVASGIFPVFSSGNPGPECGMAGSPGDYVGAYSVGNYDANGHIAGDSGRGPGVGEETKPNISAPGTAVRSSVPDDKYQIYNGTSMAAPHVAGTVALLWSAAPALLGDVSGTRLLLDDTARDQADDQCGGDADDNNVYGEGRLDALALVNAAPRGDTGLLTGKVVESGSGEAVANAHLTITGPTQRQAVTDRDGEYSVALSPGDYEVVVSRFGYDDVTVAVSITAHETVRRDVDLIESAPVRVRGRVTDGSGHGWPLYARVDIAGTSVRTFSDPVTGRFELTVPAGHTYRLRTEVRNAGYDTHVEDLVVGDRASTHDVQVPVDASTCTALGFARTGGLREDFGSRRTTDRWEVVDALGNGQTWSFADVGERGNLTGGTGRFAVVDSDHYGHDGTQDTALVSPAVDLGAAENPVLEFASDFWENWQDTADVDLSVDGGETWSNVWRKFQTVRGPQSVRIPVPQAAGQDDVRVRFHYLRGSDDWWWQVDDVFLGEPTCAPVKGGLVVGQTRSTVTRRPLVGVEVRGSGSPVTATSVGTPADDGAPDGFYWLFTPGSGHQRLTAALDDHMDADAQVRVRDDGLVHQDLGLRSGRLDPVPRTITVEVRQGQTAQRRVTLVNTGDATVRYDLEEVPGRPHGTPASDTGSWESIAPYPTGTAAGLAGVLDGVTYSFGGLGKSGSRSDSYRYDEQAQAWVRLADLPEPRRRAAGGFVDGRFVVTSGWDRNEQIIGATSIYDPETDTWTKGAPNPRPWTASASAVLEGRLYVVGGCGDDAACSHADVMVYDVATDTWSQAADYPQPVGSASCGGIGGKIYCAGGYGPGGDRLAAFAYDPAEDEWTRIADMPIDLWGSATAVDSDRLIMIGGITNKGSLVTAESIAYDPRGDEWIRLPEGPFPLYRATGVCGMTIIGGADDHVAGIINVEQLPYGGDCEPAHDRPWLRTSGASGQVAADRSRSLTLKLDARKVDGPGVYDAYLRFAEDTPYETDPVRVRLVVRR